MTIKLMPLLLLMPILLQAKVTHDLLAESYPVLEDDLIAVIKHDLQQNPGKVKKIQSTLLKSTEHYVSSPGIKKTITNTKVAKTRVMTPVFTVPQDIVDAYGNVIYQKGERINPLHYSMPRTDLIFINADNSQQVHWLKLKLQTRKNYKIVLTQGNPRRLSQLLKQPVFFDQGGILTEKLAITHVPTVVTTNHESIIIHEEVAR